MKTYVQYVLSSWWSVLSYFWQRMVLERHTPYVLFSSLEYKMGESAFTIVPLYWSKHDSEEEDGGGGIACAPLPSVQLLIIRGKLV